MKSPLWILTSALAVLLLATLGYILYSLSITIEPDQIISIKPTITTTISKKNLLKPQDISIIYQDNDLFKTYKLEQPKPVTPAQSIAKEPTPPIAKSVTISPSPVVQFLEPIPVTISGIIAHSSEAKSQVTLINNATKKSSSYKIGEKVFDAYILRIFPNKIILLRSNGQQDTLYMHPEEAQEELRALQDSSWSEVIQKESENSYKINPAAFIKRITSLAHLIDMLDLTTAYQKGTSIGCRIGSMHKNSIGHALGLVTGDIITSINSIEPTTTTNRVQIYNLVASLSLGDIVTIKITRNKQNKQYQYILEAFQTQKPIISQTMSTSTTPALKASVTTNMALDNTIKNSDAQTSYQQMMQDKQKLNTTIKDIKKRNKLAMTNYGSKRSVLKDIPK